MNLKIVYGEKRKPDFLNEVYSLDREVYKPQYCGELDNLKTRFQKNKDSFILLYNEDELAGYINFFPVCEDVHKNMVDRTNGHMYDDDITPEQIEKWEKGKKHNIFILSVVVKPKYQRANNKESTAVIDLSEAFLEFLKQKQEAEYNINSISGFAVSLGGVKFLKNLNASLLKKSEHGEYFFISFKDSISKLFDEGITTNHYEKSFENDVYFFVPMTSINKNFCDDKFWKEYVLDDKAIDLSPTGEYDYCPTEHLEKLSFGELYCTVLDRHIVYESNSDEFKKCNLKRVYLGEFELAYYDDDYDDIALDNIKCHLFITAHKNTGLYIATLAIPNNSHSPSQLIDQMSTRHLKIKNTENPDYISIEEYMKNRFGICGCGESKSVVCMSNEPDDELELPYILSGETRHSRHIDYLIRPARRKELLKNHAVYDYYSSYISRSVIAFIFNSNHEGKQEIGNEELDFKKTERKITWKSLHERISDEASELFIVEIVLFQNTAVLRTNAGVVDLLAKSNKDDIDMEKVDELYFEFGKTMVFWNSDVFKYPFSQKEADIVVESFGTAKTAAVYHRNQQFLDRAIEVKSNIAERKSDDNRQKLEQRLNDILYYLTCIECCSVTLAAVLWLVNLHESPASIPSLFALIARLGWIFIFITLCIIIHGRQGKNKKHKKTKE